MAGLKAGLNLGLRTWVPAPLARALGWGSLQAAGRLVCGFLSIKVTAVYLGPAGLALVAQFNNLLSLCQALLSTGLDTAAGRLTAEYGDDATRRRPLLATAARLVLGLGLGLAAAMALASPWLAQALLGDARWAWAFALGGVSVLAGLANAVLVAVLNARGHIGTSALAGILATGLGLMLFAPAAMRWGVPGGLAASALATVAALACTVALTRKNAPGLLGEFRGRFEAGPAWLIARFYPMLLVHATLVPLTTLLVRDTLSDTLGLSAAGLWQACWRLSETYLMVLVLSVSLVFQPRLGRLVNDRPAFRAEVWRTVRAVTLLAAAMALLIYAFRHTVVRLVFSSAFAGVEGLMPLQLLGDVFKMLAWLLGFVLVALLRSRWFVLAELTVATLFVGGVHLWVEPWGLQAATAAYALAYLTQASVCLLGLRDVLWPGIPAPAPTPAPAPASASAASASTAATSRTPSDPRPPGGHGV